jgi:hypothetical protein
MANNLTNLSLLFGVLAILFFSASCSDGVSSTALTNTPEKQTDKIQPLSPKDILLNQPDFTAEQQYFMFESHKHGGFSVSEKLSKKGSVYRWESFDNVNFLRFDQPPVFCSANGKNCFEKQGYDDCCGYLKANQVENFARASDATFELAGSEIVQGHNCIKIKMENVAKEETIYFYAAEDLKNLVIKTEVIQSDRKHTFILGNVSFDVPNKLFEPIENFNRKRI